MTKIPFELPTLPPDIDYEKFVSELGRAHASIAKLDALLSQLKNPRLLARTIVTREAVMSSQIEGTEATLSEVLEQDAKNTQEDETRKFKDYQEIINYRQALEEGLKILKDSPLTENIIKNLHLILLSSSRGHNKAPGEFRKKVVFIGKPGATIEEASYIPPMPTCIPELFSNLEKYIHSEEKDLLVQIAVSHYQFEAIHPFEDGNGRIGRLIISLMLHSKKLLSYPFIYLSEFFEEHRREYYDLLRGVSEQGNWEDWIAFFLRGIDTQARKAQEVCQKILDLYEITKTDSTKLNSRYAHDLVDALFQTPYFGSRNLKINSEIKNSQTLFTLIDKFLKAGIISDATPYKKRNKIYKFDALIKILEE